MNHLDLQSLSFTGIKIGLGLAVVPAAITGFIACSKIIFLNLIGNVAIRILSANTLSVQISASFIAVPFLWKVSRISAICGGVVFVISLLAGLVDSIYRRSTASR